MAWLIKNPNLSIVLKIPQKPWDYAWKWEKQCKRKGKIDIPAYGERNFARILEENDKKFLWSLAELEREKKIESFEKMFKQIKTMFLKNLIHDVRLIEKQVRSIEPSRGSLKILKRISIDQKIDWINRKSRKTSF